MKYKRNKLLSIFLALVMVAGLLPTAALAADPEWAEGKIRLEFGWISPSTYRDAWQDPRAGSAGWVNLPYWSGGAATLLDADGEVVETYNGEARHLFTNLKAGTYTIRLDILDRDIYKIVHGVVNGGPIPHLITEYETEVEVEEGKTSEIQRWVVLEYKAYGFKTDTEMGTFANGEKEKTYYTGENSYYDNPDPSMASSNPIFNMHNGIYYGDSASLYAGMNTLEEPVLSEELENQGWCFSGWTLDGDDTGRTYTTNEALAIRVTHDILLHAAFEKKGYTVTWKNGTDTLETDEFVRENTAPSYDGTTPEKADYEFMGWSKNKDASTGLAAEDLPKVTEDVTYYAIFRSKIKETATIKFNLGENGTTTNDALLQQVVKKGDTAEAPKVQPKNGYTFKGWGIQGIDGVIFTDAAFPNLPMNADVVYVAIYEKDGGSIVPPNPPEKVKVHFDIGEHGKQTDTTELNQTIPYETSPTTPKVNPNSGYTFLGWTIDGGYGTIYSEAAINHMKITTETTFRAHYQKSSSGGGGGGGGGTVIYYVLDFEENGGSRIAPLTVLSGTNVDVTGYVPVRAGYTFLGWYAEPALKTPVEKVKMSNNKIVYADWKKNGDPDDKDSKPGMDTGKETADVPAELNGEYHFDYIVGYPDGYVYPKKNITRAEVAMIFFRLLQDDVRDTYYTKVNHFTDMQADMWHNTAVSTMANMGILKGYKDGSFRPNGAITRAEFAAIAARFDKRISDGITPFSDIYGHWAQFEIIKAAENGWVAGYPNGTFLPDAKITRAEAMAMINRVLKRNPRGPEDLLEHMIRWPDNLDTSKWYYLDVQEATNSHDYERETKSTEKWTKIQPSKDWMALER
ncbi:MAG: S-layer homology domain-containing protein [Anaerotignum sp.]|nr:S-layer homology domain-containing protein [Anaerotignum sp.]